MTTQEEDEQIYFGDNYVDMYKCTGTFHKFSKDNIQIDPINPENAEKCVKYMLDLSYIKPEYKDHYVPAVPETNIHYISEQETKAEEQSLEVPLIKFSEGPDSTKIKAIISGHRSAVIKGKDNTYYRLKGCGNDLLGFNLLKGEGYFVEHNIRGCQFDNTCQRELYYSLKVEESLKGTDIIGGNSPEGYWKYSNELNLLEHKGKQPLNEVPEVFKYCGIFKTKADKRLRTHLLGGLEIILRGLVKLGLKEGKIDQKNLEELLNIYPEARKGKIETYKSIVSFSPPFVDGKQLEVDEWCKNPVFDKERYLKFVLYDQLKEEMSKNNTLKLFLDLSNKLEDLSNILSEKLPEHKKSQLSKLIKHIIQNMDKNTNILSLLIDIYREMGYECGLIKRKMQEAHISWGSYIDHGPYNFHCNAHANNLIILPMGNKSLLAPLDYDLAYSKETYINILNDTPTFKEHDESFYENYICMEMNELGYNLCGGEDYNFDFGKKEELKDESLEDKVKNALKYLCNDVMYENYMKGFDYVNKERIIKDIETNVVLHDLIKVALVMTHDLIA